MPPLISRSLAVFVLSLTAAATGAQAPAKPPDSGEPIPRELALALLNFGSDMGAAAIRVGKAPDDIPPALLPPGFQILGSTTQFESSVIVLAAQEQPDSAVSRYEAHLLASGWARPPAPQQSAPVRGFVLADAGQAAYDHPDVACRGDEFVTYTGTYRRNGGSLVKVTYNRGTRYSVCKARQDVKAYQSAYEAAPVPLLKAPLGSLMPDGSGTSSSSNNSFSLATRLTTRLKPVELVNHFDKQLREQGWSSVADGSLQSMAVHTYRKNDEEGRAWIGMLLSIALPDTAQQDVWFKLSRSQSSGVK